MRRLPDGTAIGYCDPHAKLLYSDRKRARKALAGMGGMADGMRAYRCNIVDGMWHVGHLPENVRRGEVTAREAYGR